MSAYPVHVVAISGGKDSTAMALALAEREPRDYTYLITPTGNELPDMDRHWERLECELGKRLTRVAHNTLIQLIDIQTCLPSHAMRWCTRMLKIEPAIAWMRSNAPNGTLYVGLRADEEERPGIYTNEFNVDFPMRRWGWTVDDVQALLWERGIQIPWYTECAYCYDKRLSQWRRLWQQYPEIYRKGEEIEARVSAARGTACTFRSPSRDNWPAGLADLRKEFEQGKIPRGSDDQMDLWEEQQQGRCRVCSM